MTNLEWIGSVIGLATIFWVIGWGWGRLSWAMRVRCGIYGLCLMVGWFGARLRYRHEYIQVRNQCRVIQFPREARGRYFLVTGWVGGPFPTREDAEENWDNQVVVY